MARTARREEDTPVTGPRRHWAFRFRMQTHVLVLASELYLIRIRVGTHVLSPVMIAKGDTVVPSYAALCSRLRAGFATNGIVAGKIDAAIQWCGSWIPVPISY